MPTHYFLDCLNKRLVQFSITVIVLAVSVNCVSGQCEIQKLLEPGGGYQDRFGIDMRLDKEKLFIGAPFHDGLNEVDAGSIIIFYREGSQWIEQAILSALDGLEGDVLAYPLTQTAIS